VMALPQLAHENFHCFWATGTGWGTYSLKRTHTGAVRLTIQTLAGTLPCRSCTLDAPGSKATASVAGKKITTRVEKSKQQTTVHLSDLIQLHEGEQLDINIVG
jgi:non-lysosomal glucosylceramidase